ncbi:MAG: 50S ribosome-binding GTPase [Deltaproteobacteria bacterium]|nr:50S ribosome-binding GTPase [Deltaproteobacteria bacterium]MBF0525915.1 50S ribosome-binding GTPase [Deltaproteobacteria bacterium]
MSYKKELIERITELKELASGSSLWVDQEIRSSVGLEVDELASRVKRTEGVLFIGLMGGAGVGKSTIINALAGEKISGSSTKRPFTERPVCYHHQDTHIDLEAIIEQVKSINIADAPHQVERIRNIVVFDMPDFDSIIEEHRVIALDMLPRFDLVIWVTSPEKYGDLSFYEMLGRASQSQDNFIFVLNKTDLLNNHNDTGQDQLSQVVGGFTLKLNRAGIMQPLLFYFCALSGIDQNRDKDPNFIAFKDLVFKKREEKEIQAIKLANVESELSRIVHQVKTSLTGRAGKGAVENAEQALITDWDDIRGLSQNLAEASLAGRLEKLLAVLLYQPTQAIWPVRICLAVYRLVTLIIHGLPRTPDISNLNLTPHEETGVLVNRLVYFCHRLAHNLDMWGVKSRPEMLHSPEKYVPQTITTAALSFRERISNSLREEPLMKFGYRWRKIKHSLVLLLPLIFLVIRLLDPALISQVVRHGNWSAGYQILINLILTLYTPQGLTALLAFLLIEAIMIPLCARSYLKDINAKSVWLAGVLRQDYAAELDRAAGGLKEKLLDFTSRLKNELNRIDRLK